MSDHWVVISAAFVRQHPLTDGSLLSYGTVYLSYVVFCALGGRLLV